MAKAKITLSGENAKDLDGVVSQIKEMAATLNMQFAGLVRLPRKKLEISCRRTPCGDGSDTYEHWEKRISKRLVIVEGDEIKQILRVKVPSNVFVKIFVS